MSQHFIQIGSRRTPSIGWLWMLSAALATAAMFVNWPRDVPVLGGPMVLIFFIVPLYLYRQGHRHFLPTGQRAEHQDPRPPLLYLRSFADEPGLRNYEEALARVLSQFGPFVAIGDPKDTLAPIAAARDYVPDDAWQELVTLRLKRSQLVVLLAGATPGLAWEVEQCRKLLDPAKLLVVVPANAAAYEKFARLCEERGVSLPAFASFEHDRGPIAGLVSFDAHWQPHAHRFARITVLDPSFLHQEEEASWRHSLTEVRPAGIMPSSEIMTMDLRGHWRALPVAALAVAIVNASKHFAIW
jgi:hypothetical protein